MPGFVRTRSPLPLTNLPYPKGAQTARSKHSVTHNGERKRVVSAPLLGWPKHSPKHRVAVSTTQLLLQNQSNPEENSSCQSVKTEVPESLTTS